MNWDTRTDGKCTVSVYPDNRTIAESCGEPARWGYDKLTRSGATLKVRRCEIHRPNGAT